MGNRSARAASWLLGTVLAACGGSGQSAMPPGTGTTDSGRESNPGGDDAAVDTGHGDTRGAADAVADTDVVPAIPIAIAAGCKLSSEIAYPTTALRGYGALRGDLRLLDCGGGSLSVLLVSASDAAHAALTHAKYLSDLGALEPATSTSLGGASAWTVPGQGTVAAFVTGGSVVVVAGESAADVTSELSAITAGGRTYTASATVPMYLDRWDKHGFNFYYDPWQSKVAGYDYTQDFDYAQAHGGTGFAVLSGGPTSIPEGEGEMGTAESVWEIQSAGKRGLPVVFNNGTENGWAPVWLLSQFRNNTDRLERDPGFAASECGTRSSFDACFTNWGGGSFENALLGVMQTAMRTYGTEPNVVSILEPHGELNKGSFDLFVEYGPVADASLQTFLKTRYGSVGALNAAWYGTSGTLNSWADVHAPEVSSFAGHDQTAFDITGPWSVFSGTSATGTGVPSWAASNFDDSTWPVVTNDDSRMMLPLGATAIRTQFNPTAFSRSGTSWLYFWPLTQDCPSGSALRAFLNGSELAASPVVPELTNQVTGWSAFQVPSLTSGAQTLALSVPACTGGYVLGYQTYLSKTAPALFPNFSASENQRWVDFVDWIAWLRGTSVAGGMNMIRQVDLDKPIEMMAPNNYMDVDKENAATYGGTFHDTGFMGVFWIDELPAQMRSLGMPFSVEPPSPAGDAAGFRAYFANWLTEGVNGINYFQNIGEVTWNPEIKPVYEAMLPMIEAIGKYHGAKADAAQLFSRRTGRLMGTPWSGNANVDNRGGVSTAWALGGTLEDAYDFDAVSEADFLNGNASQYKFIVDANTSFMDDATVAAIKSWVSAGGTFVTYVQTGRNSPAGADTWPIASISGYSVASIDPMSYDISSFTSTDCQADAGCTPGLAPSWKLAEAPGQTLLQTGFAGTVAGGLHLKKVASGAEDVLLWPDGTVAVGVNPVGAGRVVTLGATFVTNEGWRGFEGNTVELIKQLLIGVNAVPVPGRIAAANATSDAGPFDASAPGLDGGAGSTSLAGATHFRHFVSNNGLYDVWIVSASSTTPAVDVVLSVSPPNATTALLPTTALDVLSGMTLPMTIHGVSSETNGIHLEPGDTRMLFTARHRIADAPGEWLTVQRGWWRGTTPPSPTPLPAPPHRYTVDLSTAYPLGEGTTGWSKGFTVPSTWAGGTKSLWVCDYANPIFLDQGSVQIDGKTVQGPGTGGAQGVDVTTTLTPGSQHTFSTQVTPGGDTISGVRGEAWIRYTPTATHTLSLLGTWSTSSDGVTWNGSATLPGAWSTAPASVAAARRSIDVPASWAGTDIVLSIRSSLGLSDAIVNGQWVRGASGWEGTDASIVHLNLTSLVTPGATNTIEIFMFGSGPSAASCAETSCVEILELDSFPANGLYP